MHPAKIFSACIGRTRSACTSRSRAADDKEKCCLESRSWLNLGHPDDGACTFSTILLFLLSTLPRVRFPAARSTEPTPSLSIYLSRAYSSLSLSPPSSFPLSIPLAFLLSHSPRTSLLFHRSPPSLFLPLFFFSPPDTIQGSSSGGRPDANRRKKEREREDRGTVMPRVYMRARRRDLQIAKARTSLAARAVSIATRSFVASFVKCRGCDRWAYYGAMFDFCYAI